MGRHELDVSPFSYPRGSLSALLPRVCVLLSECAWLYLALRALSGASNPGFAFGPAAVLAPYGLAALTTFMLGLWSGTRDSGLSAVLAGIVFTAVNLLLGVTCLLGVMWWEMYVDRPVLDPAWLNLILEDARRSPDAFPPVAVLAMLAIFLWWRGTHLVRTTEDFVQLAARFFWGTAALLVVLGMGGATPVEPAEALASLAGYLLFGLIALAISRLQGTVEERQGNVDARWGARSAVLALLLLAAGFGVAFFLLPLLGELARWLRDWTTDVLLPLLLEILSWIAHLLGLDQPPKPMPLPEPGGPKLPAGEGLSILSLPEWLRDVMRHLFNLTWIVLILYALYQWISHWRWDRHRPHRGDAGRERLPWRFRLALKELLLCVLRALLARWPSLSQCLPEWARAPEERAWTIRELYRRLLAWAERNGRAREPWTTPREFEAVLVAWWPSRQKDLHTLTESYLHARYGSLTIAADELAAAVAGWQRVVGSGRRKGAK